MSLKPVEFQQYNMPVRQFFDELSYTNYELDTPYQRGHVWGVERQRNFVRSLLLRLPIGAIVTNARHKVNNDRHPEYDFPADSKWTAVIDGKQRITALRAWVNDEVDVPKDWFDAEDVEDSVPNDKDMIVYSDLTRRGKSTFEGMGATLVVCESSVATVAKEAEIFDLINFGGVPQGTSDL